MIVTELHHLSEKKCELLPVWKIKLFINNNNNNNNNNSSNNNNNNKKKKIKTLAQYLQTTVWTLQSISQKCHSWILQVFVTEVQLSQGWVCFLQNWSNMFTGLFSEFTVKKSVENRVKEIVCHCHHLSRPFWKSIHCQKN